jgi:hypothetical protein
VVHAEAVRPSCGSWLCLFVIAFHLTRACRLWLASHSSRNDAETIRAPQFSRRTGDEFLALWTSTGAQDAFQAVARRSRVISHSFCRKVIAEASLRHQGACMCIEVARERKKGKRAPFFSTECITGSVCSGAPGLLEQFPEFGVFLFFSPLTNRRPGTSCDAAAMNLNYKNHPKRLAGPKFLDPQHELGSALAQRSWSRK